MTPEAQLKGFIAKFMLEIAALADAGRSVAGADLTAVSPFPFNPLTSSLALSISASFLELSAICRV